MKKLLLVLVGVFFLVSCAPMNEGGLVKDKDDMSVKSSSAPAPVKIVSADKAKGAPIPITVEKTPEAQNSIKISNLVWETSDNCVRIHQTPENKFIFDLGISYQLGINDGFNGIKITRDERVVLYPLMKEYLEKDKIKFIDINTAYEGGFDAAVKYVQQNKSILSAISPDPKITKEKPPEPEKTIKGRTGQN